MAAQISENSQLKEEIRGEGRGGEGGRVNDVDHGGERKGVQGREGWSRCGQM